MDDPAQLARRHDGLDDARRRLPVVLPVHPRTLRQPRAAGRRSGRFRDGGALITTEPLGYLDFLGAHGRGPLVLTDSGGVQEETTVLGVPCLTLRDSTERPVTVEQGTNRLVDPYDTAADREGRG